MLRITETSFLKKKPHPRVNVGITILQKLHSCNIIMPSGMYDTATLLGCTISLHERDRE